MIDRDLVETIARNGKATLLEFCRTKRERSEVTRVVRNLEATAIQYGAAEYERGRKDAGILARMNNKDLRALLAKQSAPR